MTGRRQAPKQNIIAINKVGPWGNVRYEHQLACGHSELLVRASSAKRIACSSCMKNAAEVESVVPAPTGIPRSSVPLDYFDTRLDFEETFGEDEILVRRVAADIASLLGIPVDAVSVNTDASAGRTVITSAYVFLSGKDISRLTHVRGASGQGN